MLAISHRPGPRLDAVASFVRDTFWVLAIGVIVTIGFFFSLGALDPAESAGVTVVAGVLVLLWIVHAWAGARHAAAAARDPRLVHARERRGF